MTAPNKGDNPMIVAAILALPAVLVVAAKAVQTLLSDAVRDGGVKPGGNGGDTSRASATRIGHRVVG